MEQRKLNRLLLKPLNLKTNEEEYFDGESFKNWNLRNGQLRLSDTTFYEFASIDFIDHGTIGRGDYSIIHKMEHRISGTGMAVKNVRSNLDKKQEKQMLKELDIFMGENTCPHIVQFYGILFQVESCWIFIELMDTSLDRFYKFVYHKLDQIIPESVLAYIAVVILQTLHYLRSRWQIIHRNIKPSNILISRTKIKLCNFGVIDRIVNPLEHRCGSDSDSYFYLSPERIDSESARQGYCYVQSAVWSFGITMYELSTGYYPFSESKSVFDILQRIVEEPSLKLTVDRLSDHCKDFVNTCLIKDGNERPKYKQLLEHPFLDQMDDLQQIEHAIASLSDITNELEQNMDTFKRYYLSSTSQ